MRRSTEKFAREHRLAKMKVIAVVEATNTIGDERIRQQRVRHEEDSDENAWLLGLAWDDVTGALLDPREVRQARLKEMRYHTRSTCTRRSTEPRRNDAGSKYCGQDGLMLTRVIAASLLWNSTRQDLMGCSHSHLLQKHSSS